MPVVQGSDLNTDTNGKNTSSEYGDRGDGTSRWYQWRRTANGGDATQGATADAAVTDPTSAGTVVALLKGILTACRLSAAGLLKAEDAPASSGDAGVQVLAIRRDTATSDAAAGDYHALHVDALGRLHVAETGVIDGIPPGATQIQTSSGNVANAAAVATLAGAASVTTYITGFEVTAAGATAGLPVIVTVAGISGGTLSYIFVFPAGVLVGAVPLVVEFAAALPASAANTAIVVTCPAGGAGNTHAAVTAHGYRL
jgi:hypothetical protein